MTIEQYEKFNTLFVLTIIINGVYYILDLVDIFMVYCQDVEEQNLINHKF